MIAIITLLLVISLSILVTRVATIALTHTGLSREAARFQARSAFTGAGFTTTESEKVVTHPVRRRIVLLLMLLGNAGIVTAVSSLIPTLVDQADRESSLLWKVVLLIAGVVVLWGIATSTWVDRHLSRLIDRLLRRFTSLDVRDYAHQPGDTLLLYARQTVLESVNARGAGHRATGSTPRRWPIRQRRKSERRWRTRWVTP